MLLRPEVDGPKLDFRSRGYILLVSYVTFEGREGGDCRYVSTPLLIHRM